MIEAVMRQYATVLTIADSSMDYHVGIMKTYAGEDLSIYMPYVRNYRFGDILDTQTLPCAIITPRETVFLEWTQGKEDALHTIGVSIVVADTDPVRLEKLCWRYAQAASAALQASMITGADVLNYTTKAWEYMPTIIRANDFVAACTIVTESRERCSTSYP